METTMAKAQSATKAAVAAKTTTQTKGDAASATNKAAKNEAKAVNAVVDTALVAYKSTVQSVEMMEQKIADAALITMRHASKTGDVMPSDRLIKGIEATPHPMGRGMILEIVAWFKANSPIYWDAKKNPHQRKPSEEGYKPYDLNNAEKAAFFETEQAKKARQAGADAHKKAMKPLSFKDMFGRAMGLRKTWTQASVKDANGDIRGVVAADQERVNKLFDAIEEAAKKLAA